MKIRKGYTFDDVLLVPVYSKVKSRKDIDLSVLLKKGVNLNIPIISANMKNVTGYAMAQTMLSQGGMPILHRFFDSDEAYLAEYQKVQQWAAEAPERLCDNLGVSVGVSNTQKELVGKFYDIGCRIFCIDVAHGNSEQCISMTRWIHLNYPKALLISGNVATADGASRLESAGADVIKLNIGNGSLCTTRIETGNGVPTLTAISDVAEWRSKNNSKVKLICDGGMRRAGDIVKALCFTDCVMLGNILAGTDEAPGDIIEKDGIKYKKYVGSSTLKVNHIEGVEALVECKGPVAGVIEHLLDGIRSGCSYQGVDHVSWLQDVPEFIEISNSGLIESHPHDVTVSKK